MPAVRSLTLCNDRSFTEQLQWHIRHKAVHKDEMAYASGHYEQMKDFVGAEVLMLLVKDGNLKRVDHSSYRIDDASCQQPAESRRGKGV